MSGKNNISAAFAKEKMGTILRVPMSGTFIKEHMTSAFQSATKINDTKYNTAQAPKAIISRFCLENFVVMPSKKKTKALEKKRIRKKRINELKNHSLPISIYLLLYNSHSSSLVLFHNNITHLN